MIPVGGSGRVSSLVIGMIGVTTWLIGVISILAKSP